MIAEKESGTEAINHVETLANTTGESISVKKKRTRVKSLNKAPAANEFGLSEAEIRAAKRLDVLWNQHRHHLKLTQGMIAEYAKIRQPTVNHYLKGRIPLNIKIVMIFAHFLEIQTTDIFPELFAGIDSSPEIPDFVKEAMNLIERCDPKDQQTVLALLRSLAPDSRNCQLKPA